MDETSAFPYLRVAGVALVMSALGVAAVLLPIHEMDDFWRSYWLVAIVSVLLWFVLARQLKGRPVWVAVVIGLLSPLLGCAASPIGFIWAVFLWKVWYFTIPIGVATGVVMHRVMNDPSGTSRRQPGANPRRVSPRLLP